MAFYIRYYEDEILLQKAEEILPYLQGLNKFTPEELDIINKRITKLRSGTNRIYLDAAKKRYLLAIGTAQTSIEAFQKNAKRQPAANAETAPQPEPEKKQQPINEQAAMLQSDGWMFYNLYFSLLEDEQPQSFIFKAKIRNANLQSAYNQMTDYLKNKHGERCLIPEFSENVIWSEPVTDIKNEH